MSSIPQTYTISDFIEWHSKNQLILSPDFQRGSVWTVSAKVYLIDTILNDLPMPQLFFRTKVNLHDQTTVREVVDGQQRLRAILEFASGKLRLSSKAPKFRGMHYSDLSKEDQENFLSYKLPAVQLLNASDSEVLEVFARLNSYSVKVTPAELRHAEYSEPIKWAIYDATMHWTRLWNEYRIVSIRDSVRLKNTSVMAEMFMALDIGFGNGGEGSIAKYYRHNKGQSEAHFESLRKNVDRIVQEIIEKTGESFVDTIFFDAPNFLALFATVAYLRSKMANSRVSEGVEQFHGKSIDWEKAQTTLAEIAQAFDIDDNKTSPYIPFVSATKSTTHRVLSRKVRFQCLVNAIAPDEVE